jgi:hypothetical protein
VKHRDFGSLEIKFGHICISIYGEDDTIPELVVQTAEEAMAYDRVQAMRIATGDKPKAKKA